MIDYGLLASMMLVMAVPSVVAYRWPLGPPDESPSFVDLALGPALLGLVVGRIATLAIDDPRAIGRLSDMLIIRSGVEFWPGALAAVAVVAWAGRRNGAGSLGYLAAAAPLSMIGYGSYEMACLLRDGCYGPESSLGLVPPGLTTTMLPVGLVAGLGTWLLAWVLRRWSEGGATPPTVLLSGLVSVALVRSVASIWLPHVGEGLTRQHLTSILVLAVAVSALAGSLLLERGRSTAS